MCERILRSANYAVKAAQSPSKKVILVISYVRYKSLKYFIDFEKIKNADAEGTGSRRSGFGTMMK